MQQYAAIRFKNIYKKNSIGNLPVVIPREGSAFKKKKKIYIKRYETKNKRAPAFNNEQTFL